LLVKGKYAIFELTMSVEFTFDFDKFLAVMEYLASRGVPELSKYKICKLIFLADKYHLVRYGRPIIGDRYCALPYGPVPSMALDLMNAFIKTEQSPENPQVLTMRERLALDRAFLHPRFSAKVSPTFQFLSKSDLMALDHVIERYGQKNFDELKSLTHDMYAFRNTWQRNPSGQMSYLDFFEEEPDAIEGAREEMLENDALTKAFPDSDV
jgi:uncharacterized phage-associated protein